MNHIISLWTSYGHLSDKHTSKQKHLLPCRVAAHLKMLPKCWYARHPSVRILLPSATLSKMIFSKVSLSLFLHSTMKTSPVCLHTPPRIQACLLPVIRPRLYFLQYILCNYKSFMRLQMKRDSSDTNALQPRKSLLRVKKGW